MIIGIFGDSFSNGDSPLSWTNILKTDYNYKTKNFGKPSTNLFWSYKQLKSNIDSCDLIVFVITNPGRLYHDTDYGISTLFTVINLLKDKSLTPERRALYQAAEQYFIHLSNYEFDEYVHSSLVDSIKTLCSEKNKRLILIPAFDLTVCYQTTFKKSLMYIHKKELFTVFNDTTFRLENESTRANHLSKENNKILANIVDRLIKNENIIVDDNLFVYEKYENPGLYWKL